MDAAVFLIFGVFWLLGLVVGFLPTFIAVSRRHPSVLGIFLVNFLLGWTVVGWVVALVWACSTPRVVVVAPQAGYGYAPARLLCPRCGGEVSAGQRFCGHCGAAV